MVHMFLSNNPSSEDINLSNLFLLGFKPVTEKILPGCLAQSVLGQLSNQVMFMKYMSLSPVLLKYFLEIVLYPLLIQV